MTNIFRNDETPLHVLSPLDVLTNKGIKRNQKGHGYNNSDTPMRKSTPLDSLRNDVNANKPTYKQSGGGNLFQRAGRKKEQHKHMQRTVFLS